MCFATPTPLTGSVEVPITSKEKCAKLWRITSGNSVCFHSFKRNGSIVIRPIMKVGVPDDKSADTDRNDKPGESERDNHFKDVSGTDEVGGFDKCDKPSRCTRRRSNEGKVGVA